MKIYRNILPSYVGTVHCTLYFNALLVMLVGQLHGQFKDVLKKMHLKFECLPEQVGPHLPPRYFGTFEPLFRKTIYLADILKANSFAQSELFN